MIKEEIIIEVTDNGLTEATNKANALNKATKAVGDTTKAMAGEMRGASNSVLENGGAMGLLNDATGGYAMMVKDAVEASVLFTKSQRLATIQQKAYSLIVGTSTGAMKLFRIALISTGLGAIVVALGLLIANFDKVKKAVMNLIPGLSVVADFIGGLIDAVTDFIGVTSDATRALDKMVADAQKSLKKSEYFLEANGDKYDEYTQRKIKANIDYNKKVVELAADEELTEKEKFERLKAFREKANREIVDADADRNEKLQKARDEAQKKIDEAEAKRKADKKRDDDIAKEKEKERLSAIAKILDDYKKKGEDALAKSNLEKINLEEKRALEELERLKATEEEKAKVRAYYDNLRKEDEAKLNAELDEALKTKQEAERSLALDQKEWEIENEVDPIVKLQKKIALLEEEAEIDKNTYAQQMLDATISQAEKLKLTSDYQAKKQESNQAISDNEKQLAEEQKIRDKAVAQNRINIATQTVQLIAQLAGEGSAIAKGVAVAQATIDTYKGAVSAYSAMSGIPIVGPVLGAVAAGVVVAAGLANVKKILSTKPVEKGSPSGGVATPAPPPAPSFNLVQGTGANQIAQSIGGQNQPIQAFVVAQAVTNGQALDRNIVENSTL